MALSNIPFIIQIVIAVIGIVGSGSSIGYFIASYKNGRVKAESELNKTLLTRLGQIDQTNQAQTQEILRLQRMKKADDDRIQGQLQILENRSPILENTLNEIIKQNTEILAHMENEGILTLEPESPQGEPIPIENATN